MSQHTFIARSILAGLTLAAAASGAAYAKPNAQLTIAENAPIEVQAAFASWKGGERLSGRKDKCYGIALAGENDCKAGKAPAAKVLDHQLPGQRLDLRTQGRLRVHPDSVGPASLNELIATIRLIDQGILGHSNAPLTVPSPPRRPWPEAGPLPLSARGRM